MRRPRVLDATAGIISHPRSGGVHVLDCVKLDRCVLTCTVFSYAHVHVHVHVHAHVKPPCARGPSRLAGRACLRPSPAHASRAGLQPPQRTGQRLHLQPLIDRPAPRRPRSAREIGEVFSSQCHQGM